MDNFRVIFKQISLTSSSNKHHPEKHLKHKRRTYSMDTDIAKLQSIDSEENILSYKTLDSSTIVNKAKKKSGKRRSIILDVVRAIPHYVGHHSISIGKNKSKQGNKSILTSCKPYKSRRKQKKKRSQNITRIKKNRKMSAGQRSYKSKLNMDQQLPHKRRIFMKHRSSSDSINSSGTVNAIDFLSINPSPIGSLLISQSSLSTPYEQKSFETSDAFTDDEYSFEASDSYFDGNSENEEYEEEDSFDKRWRNTPPPNFSPVMKFSKSERIPNRFSLGNQTLRRRLFVPSAIKKKKTAEMPSTYVQRSHTIDIKEAKINGKLRNKSQSEKFIQSPKLKQTPLYPPNTCPSPFADDSKIIEHEKTLLMEQMQQLQYTMVQLGDMLRNQDSQLLSINKDNVKLTTQCNQLVDENLRLHANIAEITKARNDIWTELEYFKLAARTRRDKIVMLSQQLSQLEKHKKHLTKYSEDLLDELANERKNTRKMKCKIRKYTKNVKRIRKRTKSMTHIGFGALGIQKSVSYDCNKPTSTTASDSLITIARNISIDTGCDSATEGLEEDLKVSMKRRELKCIEIETFKILHALEVETQKLLEQTKSRKQKKKVSKRRRSKKKMRKPRKRQSLQKKNSKNLLSKPKLVIRHSNPVLKKSIKKKTISTTTTTTTKTIDLINSTIETKTETKTNIHEHKEENVPNEKKQILITKTQTQTETEVKIDDILDVDDDGCMVDTTENTIKREIISPSKRADTPHNYLLFFPKTHEEHESKVAPEVNSKDINCNTDDSNHKNTESKSKSVMTTVDENEIFDAVVIDDTSVVDGNHERKNNGNSGHFSSEELDWDISSADSSDSEDNEGLKKKRVTFAVQNTSLIIDSNEEDGELVELIEITDDNLFNEESDLSSSELEEELNDIKADKEQLAQEVDILLKTEAPLTDLFAKFEMQMALESSDSESDDDGPYGYLFTANQENENGAGYGMSDNSNLQSILCGSERVDDDSCSSLWD